MHRMPAHAAVIEIHFPNMPDQWEWLQGSGKVQKDTLSAAPFNPFF